MDDGEQTPLTFGLVLDKGAESRNSFSLSFLEE